MVFTGDSLEIVKGIADASIDMVFTDPPYGHNNNNGDLIDNWEKVFGRQKTGGSRPIMNDGVEADEMLLSILPEVKRILVPGGVFCCCCGGGGGEKEQQYAKWTNWIVDVLRFKQMVVWDKGPMGLGKHYRRSYEVVLVAFNPGAKCNWYDNSKRVENIIRLNKIIPRKDQHPTVKPVALAEFFIRLHSKAGDLVFDPFCGSGTTGVACKKLGRKFIGVDIDPHWADVARDRIEREVTCLDV